MTQEEIEKKEFHEAMQAMWEAVKITDENNLKFISQFGETALEDFKHLTEDVRIIAEITFVDKPSGRWQEEDYGIFKNTHVNQWNDGHAEDCYSGYIYAQVGERWIKIPYEC